MAHDEFDNNTSQPGEENEIDDGEMEVEDEEEATESSETDEEDEEDTNAPSRVYLPNQQNEKNVELEYDESAYICYHAVKTGYPCLSFDIVPDSLGNDRSDQYPLTMTVVGGTEVKKVHGNSLLVMKLSNMQKNKAPKMEDNESNESGSESETEQEDDKPKLDCLTIRHGGCVNRVKAKQLNNEPFAVSWSELGKVHIWDLSRPVSAVNDSRIMASYIQNNETVEPLFTFSGHLSEGYAVEWSPLMPGVLATGDCKHNIHMWKPLEGGTWHVDQRPFSGHTASVEDIQWSPNESNVMASCSADKSIRIWDMRAAPNKACMLTKNNAHDSDVNVISWNKSDPFILSGGDDGKLRVWDLRQFPDKEPICTFKYHTAPITTVEWHPTDHSVFAAAASDNVLTQWDLAIERDEDQEEGGEASAAELLALPPQLLFLHQGQKEIKELHWHKQMPGVLVSTAQNGLNVIRTMSV